MDKASKALRRSSVRLKSMGSGHRELNMAISELRDVRSTAKSFADTQNTASQDLLKWSLCEENPAIQDTFVQLSELNALWTEVQKEFTDNLKAFIAQFEMILEGEQHIDQARTHITTCEMRTAKIRKELKKTSKRGSAEEAHQLEMKLAQAERSCDQAQVEVLDRIRENEAVKLIRVKEGLLKLSDTYLELAHKCHVIHEAHRDIACQIPDVHNKELHGMRYAGPAVAKQAVLRAKEQVRVYRRRSQSVIPCAPIPEGPPPPYSPTNHTESSPYNPHFIPHSFSPETRSLGFGGENSNPFRASSLGFGSLRSLAETSNDGSITQSPNIGPPSTNPFDEEDPTNRVSNSSTHASEPVTNHDIERHPDYEEDLAGAFGRVKP